MADCRLITLAKKDAINAGWINFLGNLNSVAPGKVIGGDVYRNKNGHLPSAPGRVWYEADINYDKGYRNNHRLIYSNDGLIFATYDHYMTFVQIHKGDIKMSNIDYLYSKDRVLDFSNCKYLGEVHELIKKELELPEFYGCNSDALWDAITGIMYVPANIKIIFKPETAAAQKLSGEIEKIIEVFKEAEDEYNQIKLTVEK